MRYRFCLLIIAALMSTSACSGDPSTDGTADVKIVNVFAAASLTATYEKLGQTFEASHQNAKVVFNFTGSSDLVAQIQEGAPADVVATADTANMDKLVAEGLVTTPADFASNTLQIAIPPDNPAGIKAFADLADPDLNLVVCAPEVPCGAAALLVAEAANITLSPVSEEASVTDVLGKVTSGEADAGLVYVTDVIAAGDDVDGIAIAEATTATNTYPIAAVAGSEQLTLAQEFVDLVLSAQGRAILTSAGFGRP